MLAVDTNLVVRYLIGDGGQQAMRARQIIDDNQVFICTTVLLESEWVLRSVYDRSVTQCADLLTRFAGLPTVIIEDREGVATALDWLREGLDFADALHLSQATECDAFVTFDRDFIKEAAALGSPVPVRAA